MVGVCVSNEIFPTKWYLFEHEYWLYLSNLLHSLVSSHAGLFSCGSALEPQLNREKYI